MTRVVLMPPEGAYRVAWWVLAALAAIALLLIIRGELAEWVRDWRAIHRAVREDRPAAVAEFTPQQPGRHSGQFRARPATVRRGKPTAGDGSGFPHPPGPQAVPDRFASPQEMADYHANAGLDIFPGEQR
jgi:hypothetical protein